MELQKDGCFSVGLVDDNFFKWRVTFEGPEETLYSGGLFTAEMEFPDEFPNNPPKMKFLNEMWHPNIFPDGKVCISILHAPGIDRFNDQESPDEKWRPILGVEGILISVMSMLNEPNLNSPANVDAAKQLREDLENYKKKVKRLVRKSIEDPLLF
jgi:ubiquitin-conjugating enzyme E2 G1